MYTVSYFKHQTSDSGGTVHQTEYANVTTLWAIIEGEMTPSMPRTFGDTQIHISQLDAVVKTDRPIYAQEPLEGSTDENIAKIGKYIAENLVDDGATLQIGWISKQFS
uniref:Uncharacterized protein n=1 Tax=Parascaris equorum TaxID=6256 RepID=A0A914SJS6_PAREQ